MEYRKAWPTFVGQGKRPCDRERETCPDNLRSSQSEILIGKCKAEGNCGTDFCHLEPTEDLDHPMMLSQPLEHASCVPWQGGIFKEVSYL